MTGMESLKKATSSLYWCKIGIKGKAIVVQCTLLVRPVHSVRRLSQVADSLFVGINFDNCPRSIKASAHVRSKAYSDL